MSMPAVGALHHIEINVADLDRSKAFWGWLLAQLGYSVFQEWATGASFRLDQTYLVFATTPQKHGTPSYHRGQTGLNHIAFHAASRQQVDEITQKLVDRGVPILYQDRHPFAGGPNYYAVYFEDPDRIKVEIVAPP